MMVVSCRKERVLESSGVRAEGVVAAACDGDATGVCNVTGVAAVAVMVEAEVGDGVGASAGGVVVGISGAEARTRRG